MVHPPIIAISSDAGIAQVPAIAKAPGRLILISGPSGVGKGTLITEAFRDPHVSQAATMVTSLTTRAPRPGEKPPWHQRFFGFFQSLRRLFVLKWGKLPWENPSPGAVGFKAQYRFPGEKRFQQMMAQGELFQWARYDGHWYGSTVKEVVGKLSQGINVVFELSSQMALAIKRLYPDKAVTVFIAPPPAKQAAPDNLTPLEKELLTLAKRLEGRGTNSPQSIAKRLEAARAELALKPQFDQIIVNGDNQIETAARRLKAILLNPAAPLRFSGYIQPHSRPSLPTYKDLHNPAQHVCRLSVLYV